MSGPMGADTTGSLAKQTGEGCPSKWKEEGHQTLAPSRRWSGVYTKRSGNNPRCL